MGTALESWEADYCPNCGETVFPDVHRRGSGCITFLLLCIGIIPGLIYMVWRGTTVHSRCPSCGAAGLIPVDSPRARLLLGVSQQGAIPPAGSSNFSERNREENRQLDADGLKALGLIVAAGLAILVLSYGFIALTRSLAHR